MFKKWQNLSIKFKLTACFLLVVFVLSIIQFLSYMKLLEMTIDEAVTSANERMTSAVAKLDERLDSIYNDYLSFTYTPSFRTVNNSGSPSEYEMIDLLSTANFYFANNADVCDFVIFFKNGSKVVTSGGVYKDKDFFSNYVSEEYTQEFWNEEKSKDFSKKYYPVCTFVHNSTLSYKSSENVLPVAFKTYWKDNVMVLLFLNIDMLCKETDPYLVNDFYIFDENKNLLYSSPEAPALLNFPENNSALFKMTENRYTVMRPSAYGNFFYVKQLTKSMVVGQIVQNMYFSLLIVLIALLLGIIITIITIRHMLYPVHSILQALCQGTEPESNMGDELQYIQANVENMLQQRQRYIQQILEKDAALSSFLLQSKLKNIYVELDEPKQTENIETNVFYILYFRIRYRNGTLESIPMQPADITLALLSSLRQILSQLFDTVLIFQLESNQFVAKIGVHSEQKITDMMQCLQQILYNEREYVFFTIVQSQALSANSDFALVYDQVLSAAQYAQVKDDSQFLELPLANKTENVLFSFPTELEQKLCALIRKGDANAAEKLVEHIIERNIALGICYINMDLVGYAVINVVNRALSGMHIENKLPEFTSYGVYAELPKCDTIQDYKNVISEYVRKAALYSAAQPYVEDPVVDRVQMFLEKNYQKEFSMDELAETLHLSKSYISTCYKNKTGINLSEHIQAFRIQKAVELLENPKLYVRDIGPLVGINDMNTFLRQFKKYTGMTPKEYRKHKSLDEKTGTQHN